MASFLTDGLLVANPVLSDIPKFKDVANKAIYIVEHTERGAIGLSINQNFSMPLPEVAQQLPTLGALNLGFLLSQKVISGGPVRNDIPWILGRNPKSYEQQFSNSSLSLNFSAEAFEDNQASYRSVCGVGSYGWGSGQLESELTSFLWHYFPTDEQTLQMLPFTDAFSGCVQLLLSMKSD